MPGNLPVDLEVGSIILTPGKSFDLDPHCSRKWIKTNPLLKKLFSVNALILVHDSEVAIPKVPIKKVVPIAQRVAVSAVKKPLPKIVKSKVLAKPRVIDLKDKEDVTEKMYKKPKATIKKEDPVEKLLAETDHKKDKKKSNKWHKKSYKSSTEKEPEEPANEEPVDSAEKLDDF